MHPINTNSYRYDAYCTRINENEKNIKLKLNDREYKLSLLNELDSLLTNKNNGGKLTPGQYRECLSDFYKKSPGGKELMDQLGINTVSKFSLYSNERAEGKINALLKFLENPVTLTHPTKSKNDIHDDIDTLYSKYSNIPQPCFLVAEYLQSGESIDKFEPSSDLLAVARTGKQIDFGPVFSGTEKEIKIGGITSSVYENSNKESYVIRGSERDLKLNSSDIRTHLQGAYPNGCVMKSGGGVGHYAFFDTKNNIVYSGGGRAKSEGVSGVSFEEYLEKKLNSSNKNREETLSFTSHTASEILSVGYEQVKELGVTRDEWLQWN